MLGPLSRQQHARGESKYMRSTFAPTSYPAVAASARSTSARTDGPARIGPAADPEIARLFTELRQYLGMPIPQIAQHLATHPSVIAALEAGRIDLLPGWHDTARIAGAYIAMARMDPRPALNRLAVLMGVAINATPSAHPPAPASAPAEAEPYNPVGRILGRLSSAAVRAREEMGQPGLLAEWAAHIRDTARGVGASVHSVRAPVRWVSAAALALIVLGSAAPSGILQASVGGISQPISGLWRKLSGQDHSIRVIVRDGLRWIEAEDPRDRRSDKLPSRGS
jgi:hypothetical protein